ncbi:dethiobiotin synthase [Hydrogenimonas sp.]
MAIKIFVTATNTDIGKTYTTLRLMEEASAQGLRPAAFKPIETGVRGGKPADGTLLLETMRRLNPSAGGVTIDDVVPLRFALPAAPFVAKGDRRIELEPILETMRTLEALCDILFIEGAGGLMVPIEERTFMIDLPPLFGARTLLVAPGRLGSINDTLLSMEALERRGLPFELAINLRKKEREAFEEVTLPYYERAEIDHYRLPDETAALLKKVAE